MIVFFEGAVDKWLSFTTEFTADGVIASASSKERRRAYMAPTNDVNEGGHVSKKQHCRIHSQNPEPCRSKVFAQKGPGN